MTAARSHPVSTHSVQPAAAGDSARVSGALPDGQKRICGGKTRAGGICQRPPGWGTPSTYGRCSYHAGATRTGMKHAAQLEAEAHVRRVMGSRERIAPEDALQLALDLTHGEITFCDEQLAKLTDADATVETTSDRVHEELDKHGDVHELRERTVESSALLHVWITTRQGATERLARFSKMALDAGVAERRVQLDERQTDLIAGAVLAVVGQLQSLSSDDRARVPVLLEQHVGGLHQPAIEGSVA
jgi:hypothetical protein